MKQLYLKFNLALILLVMFSLGASAQQGGSLWTKTTQKKMSTLDRVFRKTEPSAPIYYQLNIEGLKTILQNAPQRGDFNNTNVVVVDFPTTDDKFESFRVMEASVMHESLQAQFPQIRSYVGQSIQNPANVIRFSVTPQGLHTMLFSQEKGTQFIDPYTKTGNFYILYAKRNLPSLDEPFVCEFQNDLEDEGRAAVDVDMDAAQNANDGLLRTYELALACTIEYSAFVVNAAGLGSGTLAQKKAAVLAAMNVTMTRVNGVYERDFSLTMVIVPNNLAIIFIDSDNFSNDNANTLINQSQTVIDQLIGSNNYDIGHTFSTGGGGLAGVNVPCVAGSKARGITGSPTPVGDPYDIDFVSHEMGHQYGSNHTFNGDAGNCAGNRSGTNAYEPGSGSTIMAYAGICAPQNVQSLSDDYFHQRSLAVIWANISSGNSSTCSTNTSTGNSAPTAEAGANYLIPKSTPYKLTASSTDADGIGSHTYTWEQYDLGPAGVPTETTATGPLVRSFKGTTDPVRYIPKLPDLVNSYGSSEWEKLVSIARPINFKVTVRDNDVRGGQTASDAMIATVTANSGPFVVTSQNQDQIVWTPGTTETITWDVAGTTANGINTSNVNILLSTDGGLTYTTVLAANTANDGSQDILVPTVSAPYCRIMVEPVGNIYFSINTKSFAIGNYTYEVTNVCTDYFFPANIAVPVSSTQYSGFVLNVPDSFTVTDFNVSVDFTHPNIGDLFYGIRPPFQATGVNRLASGSCPGASNAEFTFDDAGTAVNCSSTTNNDVITPLDPLSIVNGQNSAGDYIFFMTDVTANGVSGVWNSATLTLCQSSLVPVLSVDSFNEDDSFTIFPNPNNGEFTIKLRSYSNNVKVEVYDIRGRSIYNTSYETNGDLNKTINLNDVQSGMYLVKVNDGVNEATKKIIVK